MTAFTHALYYPWQDIHDAAWLRTACLYWDEIATVVAPGDNSPYKSHETQLLQDNGILVPIYPDDRIAIVAAASLHDLTKSKEWKRALTAMERSQAAYFLEQRNEYVTNLHFALAWGKFNPDRILDWRLLGGSITHLYLTILASEISLRTGRALVTDKPGLRLLAESIRLSYPLPGTIVLEDGRALPLKLTRRTAVRDTGLSTQVAIVDLLLNAIKINPEVPISKIIDFRQRYWSELIQLRNEIDRLGRELRDDLSNGEYAITQDALQRAAADKYKSVEAALSRLERQLEARRIESRREWMEVALLAVVPSSVAAPALGLKSIGVGGAAAAIRLVFGMWRTRRQSTAIIDDDPYSYLLLAHKSLR